MRERFILTPIQKHIWIDQILHPKSPRFNIGGFAEIKGDIDIAAFQKSIHSFLSCQGIFRHKFSEENGEPFQFVGEEFSYQVDFIDFASKHSLGIERGLDWMKADMEFPFEFKEPPLYKFSLLKIADNHFFWYVKVHHILLDGWGLSLLFRSVSKVYNQFIIDNEYRNDKYHSYIKYIDENEQYIAGPTYQADRIYWIKKIGRIPNNPFKKLKLPNNLKSLAEINTKTLTIDIDVTTYNKINAFCKGIGVSKFHYFLGIIYIYLARMLRQKGHMITVPMLNRGTKEKRNTAGTFINIIPVYLEFDENIDFSELLKLIKISLKESYRHSNYPLSHILTDLKMFFLSGFPMKSIPMKGLLEIIYLKYFHCRITARMLTYLFISASMLNLIM